MTILVLLPGMDGSGALFAPFIAALGPGITSRVVVYPPDQPLDYRALADLARSQLPTDQAFYLLGESFSSPVAIALAAERPPMLAGLIISCGFARNPAPPLRVLRSLVRFAPLHGQWSAVAAPFLLGWNAPAALRLSLRNALTGVAAPILRLRLREVLDVDVSAQMRSVTAPVLYMQAAQDRVVFAGAVRYLATLVPTLRTVRLAGPHLLLQRAPAAAAGAVHAFIHAQSTPASAENRHVP